MPRTANNQRERRFPMPRTAINRPAMERRTRIGMEALSFASHAYLVEESGTARLPHGSADQHQPEWWHAWIDLGGEG
jgi:hypothetical protein